MKLYAKEFPPKKIDHKVSESLTRELDELGEVNKFGECAKILKKKFRDNVLHYFWHL